MTASPEHCTCLDDSTSLGPPERRGRYLIMFPKQSRKRVRRMIQSISDIAFGPPAPDSMSVLPHDDD